MGNRIREMPGQVALSDLDVENMKVVEKSAYYTFYRVEEPINVGGGRAIRSGDVLKEARGKQGKMFNKQNYQDMEQKFTAKRDRGKHLQVEDLEFGGDDEPRHIYPEMVKFYSADYRYAILDSEVLHHLM